jgi:hypothetical protein
MSARIVTGVIVATALWAAYLTYAITAAVSPGVPGLPDQARATVLACLITGTVTLAVVATGRRLLRTMVEASALHVPTPRAAESPTLHPDVLDAGLRISRRLRDEGS